MGYYPGKHLPQPYVRNIEIENREVTIDVSFKKIGMLNKPPRKGAGAHSSTSHIYGVPSNLKIAFIRISNASLLERLNTVSKDQQSLINKFLQKNRKSKNNDRFEVKNINFKHANKRFADGGSTIVFTEKFTISARPEHLSFCIIAYYDNQNDNYRAIPTNILNSFISMTIEKVILAGKSVVKAVYLSPSPANTKTGDYFVSTNAGEVWTGPAHIMPDGGIMTGKAHSPDASRLIATEVFNTKLRDYRMLDLVKKMFTPAGNNSTVGFDIGPVTRGRSAGFDIGPVTKTAKISDLLITKDANGANLLFDLNWFEFVKQQIKYPTFLESNNMAVIANILNSCKIKTITLKRAKKQTLQLDDDLEEIVAVSQADSAGKMSGGVQEISKDIYTGVASEGIKTYTASDALIPNALPGLWQYKVEIEWTDGTETYLKNQLEALKVSFKDLQRYNREVEHHERANDPRNLDLLKNMNLSKIPHQNNRGPWFHVVNNLFKLTSILRPVALNLDNLLTLQTSIIFMLHPKTASVKSIKLATEMIRNIIINIENKLNIASLSTAQKGSLNSSTGAAAGNIVRFSRNLFTHTFRKTVNTKELSGCNWDYGWNYIPTTTSVGLNKTSEIVFKRRVAEETNRFFTTDSIDEFDLNKQALSFLTPSKLNARSKTFKTYSSDPKEIISETDIIMNIINCADGAKPLSKVDCPAEPTKNFNDSPCPDRTDLSRETKINLLRAISTSAMVDKIKFDILHPESVNFEQDPLSGLSLEEQQRFNNELESDESFRCVEGDFLNEIDPSSFIQSLIVTRDFGWTKEMICNIENLEQIAAQFGASRKKLPNQIKSMLVTDSSFIVDNLFNEDGRFVMPPAAFWVKYGNIVKIEAQISFGGRTGMSVRERNWLPLTQALITTAINGGKNLLLCRMTRRRLGLFTMNSKVQLPIYDEYFLLNFPRPTRSTTNRQNQNISIDLIAKKELHVPNEIIRTARIQDSTTVPAAGEVVAAATAQTVSTNMMRGNY